MSLGLAIKAFFKVLSDGNHAAEYRSLLGGDAASAIDPPAAASKLKAVMETPKPSRSEAISFLAALQRDSRLLDIVQEPLEQYSDEQVGAAARTVLQDAGKVIDRVFAPQALSDAEEGSEIETPESADPVRYKLTGNVSGSGPFRGTLMHHGWEATRCEIPSWSGNDDSKMIVAPIELEI